jgi:hypothetical protein
MKNSKDYKGLISNNKIYEQKSKLLILAVVIEEARVNKIGSQADTNQNGQKLCPLPATKLIYRSIINKRLIL